MGRGQPGTVQAVRTAPGAAGAAPRDRPPQKSKVRERSATGSPASRRLRDAEMVRVELDADVAPAQHPGCQQRRA